MGEQPTSFRASIIDLVSVRTRRAEQKKLEAANSAKAKQAVKSSPGTWSGTKSVTKAGAKQSAVAAGASKTKFQAARAIQIIVLIVAVVYFMKSCDLF